jgi:hypothetical protein
MPADQRQTDQAWYDRLLHVLVEQQNLVAKLDGLAETQRSLIADGRADALLELLGRRQSVIDEFTAAQAKLAELGGGEDAGGGEAATLDARLSGPDVTSQQREHVRSLIDDIGARLAAVLKRDEQDQIALRGGRDEVRKQMQSFELSRQARSAYVGTASGPGKAGAAAGARFADRHG